MKTDRDDYGMIRATWRMLDSLDLRRYIVDTNGAARIIGVAPSRIRDLARNPVWAPCFERVYSNESASGVPYEHVFFLHRVAACAWIRDSLFSRTDGPRAKESAVIGVDIAARVRDALRDYPDGLIDRLPAYLELLADGPRRGNPGGHPEASGEALARAT